jgi:hypothetical protein
MLEFLLVVLLVLGILVIAYRGAIHEFQILQKDWAPTMDWSALLGEQLPIVIRNVDPSWQGSWTRRATQQKDWPIRVRGGDGGLFKASWSEWISSAPGQPPIERTSLEAIGEFVAVPTAAWSDGEFRRWSWLPTQTAATALHILGPTADAVMTCRKTTAAATLLQSCDGAPLQVWLAHEGAVPASLAQQLIGRNPWALTSDQFPWINEVKFIEIKLRPGNAMTIPTHWYFAVRPMLPVVSDAPTMADGAWFWTAEFQTPISALVSTVRGQK